MIESRVGEQDLSGVYKREEECSINNQMKGKGIGDSFKKIVKKKICSLAQWFIPIIHSSGARKPSPLCLTPRTVPLHP
jgi:hypothetical protein